MFAIRKLFLILFLLGLSINFVGCSSSDDVESDVEVTEEENLDAVEETADADLEGDSPEGDELSDLDAAAEGELDSLSDDFADATDVEGGTDELAESLPEEPAVDPGESGLGTTEEFAAVDESAPTEDLSQFDEAPAPPPVEDSSSFSNNFGETADTSDASSTSTQTWVPVKKVKDTPFQRAGTLANSVYIARSGDDLSSISQKIYGTDRSSDLLALNPHLSRGVDIGDKVYYNSPNRPTDEDRILTYYEDIGVTPQIYTTANGDNIRDLATQLIGQRESWKEIWATNPQVESKWALPSGLELRYWPEGSASNVPVAANNPEPEPLPIEDEIPPPPPVEDVASNEPPLPDIPPPPPGDDMMGGGIGSVEPPPPPPPPPDIPPPPPVEEPQMAQKGGAMDKDTTFLLGVGGIVLLGLLALIAIRRKSKARKLRMGAGETQV